MLPKSNFQHLRLQQADNRALQELAKDHTRTSVDAVAVAVPNAVTVTVALADAETVAYDAEVLADQRP